MIENKRILITGAAGSIGSELVRQLSLRNNLFIIDNNESEFFNIFEDLRLHKYQIDGRVGDVRAWGMFQDIAYSWGIPELIFHCAALKHVTPSAISKEEYITTNINGTLNVLNFAKRHGCKVINISTDKVVNPNSIMGATKKVAEIAVRDAGHVSVRFGNVMGSRGSVLEIWQRQIDKKQPLTVTDEKMERYMMTIPEAVGLVIEAAEVAKPGSIMILDMGKKVNILKLAIDILKKSGRKPPYGDEDITIIGARPGETITETLMTPDEEQRAVKTGNFYEIEA